MSGIIEDGVIDKLLLSPAVVAAVSTRIYPRMAPQNASFPFVVVTKAGGQTDVHHSTGAAGIAIAMVRVACYAATYKAAREITETIKDAIDGIPRGFFGSVFVMFCHRAESFDASVIPVQDDEMGFPGYADVYRIGHTH